MAEITRQGHSTGIRQNATERQLQESHASYMRDQFHTAITLLTGTLMTGVGILYNTFPELPAELTTKLIDTFQITSPFLEKLADRNLYEFFYTCMGTTFKY